MDKNAEIGNRRWQECSTQHTLLQESPRKLVDTDPRFKTTSNRSRPYTCTNSFCQTCSSWSCGWVEEPVSVSEGGWGGAPFTFTKRSFSHTALSLYVYRGLPLINNVHEGSKTQRSQGPQQPCHEDIHAAPPWNTLVSTVTSSDDQWAHWGSSPVPGGQRSHHCAWLGHTGTENRVVHQCVEAI